MTEIIGIAITSFGAIIGTWVKMTNEVTRITSRLHVLEKNEGDVKKILRELVDSVNELKLLLAEKGIK